MCERYKCTLSNEALKKAIKVLNEPKDNKKRLAEIDKLRTRFQKKSGEKLIRTDDLFILRFLRTRKFNQDRAYETLVNYHIIRREWREVFDAVDDPKLVEHLLRSGVYGTLRDGRARDGSFVIIGRMGMGFGSQDTLLMCGAMIILSVEKLLEKEEAQVYGITFVDDMTHFGVSLTVQAASAARKFFHLLQDCLPVRVKGMHMLNESLVFDVLWAIISPFMSEKLKSRFLPHGSNCKSLHEKIDPKYLPFFLGGSGPDLNADWWSNEILSANAGEDEDTSF